MFQNWYAHEKGQNLHKDGKKIEEIDMRLSVFKPLHASWLVKTQTIEREKLTSLRVPLVPQGLSVTVN